MKATTVFTGAVTLVTGLGVLASAFFLLGGEVVERTKEFKAAKADIEGITTKVEHLRAEIDSLDRVIFERSQDMKLHLYMGPPEGHGMKP